MTEEELIREIREIFKAKSRLELTINFSGQGTAELVAKGKPQELRKTYDPVYESIRTNS